MANPSNYQEKFPSSRHSFYEPTEGNFEISLHSYQISDVGSTFGPYALWAFLPTGKFDKQLEITVKPVAYKIDPVVNPNDLHIYKNGGVDTLFLAEPTYTTAVAGDTWTY